MMKREKFAIENIYVPVKRRATLNPKKAQEIAESILQVGLQSPILVRQDGERFVLVEGLHRLEACKQDHKPYSAMHQRARPAGINFALHLSVTHVPRAATRPRAPSAASN